jgi:hypothetical protein
MRHLDVQRPAQSRVMAVFQDGAVSFDIAPAATLEELAARLARLRGRRSGALIGVAMMVCPDMNAPGASDDRRDHGPEGDRR